MRTTLLFLAAACIPLGSGFALYEATGFRPGDAVDVQSDLTNFSFSVPHQLRGGGGFIAPNYQYTPASHSIYHESSHFVGGDLFAFAQISAFRIGALSRILCSSCEKESPQTQNYSKIMASYFFRFISVGLEAGGMRSWNVGEPDTLGTGALTTSLFFNSWGIDLSSRLIEQGASTAKRQMREFQSAGLGVPDRPEQYHAARVRFDISYAWRAVFAVNAQLAQDIERYRASHTWRYRANNLQLFTGLAFAYGKYGSYSLTREVKWPTAVVLEHGASLFSIGVAPAVFSQNESASRTTTFWTLTFEPVVSYTYRFRGGVWAVFTLNRQSLRYTEYSDSSVTPPTTISASFQVTYNIAPFGYDDEVPVTGDYQANLR
jgi:hypothetical protein